jgi:SAM-dependent methyltransferase
MDWSLGRYEHVAEQLLPAAVAVVEQAAPARGEYVVDVGCGSGNAALLAAERGARVTGVDPAERLVEVASAQAAERGLEAEFVTGEAAALPIEDGAADAVLSVFGVIFAADARAAAAEMARVTAPTGRIVLSAWIPGGALGETARVGREAVAAAVGAQGGGGPPFAWHEDGALADLFGPHGFSVSTREETISFSAGSASEFLDEELGNHPLWVAARELLEPRGELEATRARAMKILETRNEDPNAFLVTSDYVVASAIRRASSPADETPQPVR